MNMLVMYGIRQGIQIADFEDGSVEIEMSAQLREDLLAGTLRHGLGDEIANAIGM